MTRALTILVVLWAATAEAKRPACASGKRPMCVPWDFDRPARCPALDEVKWRWDGNRPWRECAAKKRVRVWIGRRTGRPVALEKRKTVTAAQGDKVYRDFPEGWTSCQKDKGPAFELYTQNPRSFAVFVDPVRGACVLWLGSRTDVSSKVEKGGRLKSLGAAHPHVRQLTRELVRRAWKAKIPIHVISVYRPHKPKKGWRTRTYKSYSHWHAWGMAVDVNLEGFTTLSEPLKRYKSEPAFKAKWDALGAIARELGFTWAGDHKSKDIFHFEWHPGHGGYIRRGELERFLAQAGRAGRVYERTWVIWPHPYVTKLPPPPDDDEEPADEEEDDEDAPPEVDDADAP